MSTVLSTVAKFFSSLGDKLKWFWDPKSESGPSLPKTYTVEVDDVDIVLHTEVGEFTVHLNGEDGVDWELHTRLDFEFFFEPTVKSGAALLRAWQRATTNHGYVCISEGRYLPVRRIKELHASQTTRKVTLTAPEP